MILFAGAAVVLAAYETMQPLPVRGFR
jgi:hypothetical protein